MDSLFFIYIGKKLPYYAGSSLQLAKRYSGVSPVLVGSKKIYSKELSASCDFLPLENFYDKSESGILQSKLDSDLSFRNGLWQHSLERFFVLRELMLYLNLQDCIHAELDQLLFRIDFLMDQVRTLPVPALYLPFHTESTAVGSIVYINNIHSLEALLEFSKKVHFKSEMELIADFSLQHPGAIQALPTVATVIKTNSYRDFNHPMVPLEDLGGVVDAAQVGQWLAGIDPRNVPLSQIPRSRYVDPPHQYLLSEFELKSLHFQMNSSTGLLEVLTECSQRIHLFNIHLHSKIHKQLLAGRFSLQDLLRDSNLGRKIGFRSTRRRQIITFLLDYMKLLTHPRRVFSALLRRLGKFSTRKK